MIIVSGLVRSGTTWVAKLLGDLGGWKVAQEPFNIGWESHGDYGARHDELAQALYPVRHLLHRYDGWHDGPPGDEDAHELEALYRSGVHLYPGAQVLKIMTLPWWGVMRQAWADARIVWVDRRLPSWLSSIVRTDGALGWVTDGDWGGPMAWRSAGLSRASGDKARADLYIAAAFWRSMRYAHLRALRLEVPRHHLVVDYEALTASYEVELTRLLSWCEIGDVPAERLHACTGQPVRSWAGCRYSAEDIAIVAERS